MQTNRSSVVFFTLCVAFIASFSVSCSHAFSMSDDSTKIKSDSAFITIKRGKSGLDSLVVYSAKDSAALDLQKRKLRLRGESKTKYKTQELKAEIMEIHFGNSVLTAESAKDSLGRTIGYPIFRDGKEEFAGERISYNFTTQKGIISTGETEFGEGFYFGNRVKRINDSTMCVQNGAYTTCDATHPHFFFGSPQMKIVANEKVFINPLILYVEDVPIFMLPFGFYFDISRGRRSGIIVPSFFFSGQNGVVFQNLGYYFAINDYIDNSASLSIFTKTGLLFSNTARYKIRDMMDGNVQAQFGWRRTSPDVPMNTNWRVTVNHAQTLTPVSSINGKIDISTANFNRNFTTNLSDRFQQQLFSNASYSTTFDNNSTLSLGFSRDQNLITDEYTFTPELSYRLPQLFPFKSLTSSDNWLADVGLTYGFSANYSRNKQRNISTLSLDTTYSINERYYSIRHNPSITISPKLGYFSVTPSVSYSENWYFRKISRNVDSTGSVIDKFEYSALPLREFNYGFGVNLTTTLYGVLQPNIWGIRAFRHTFRPTIGWNYSPQISAQNTSFISSYKDTSGREIQYSIFARDGGISNRNAAQQLTYSLTNSFEAKIFGDSDSIPDKNIELFRFDVRGNYNFTADSLKFSDISTTFWTPNIGIFSLNGSAAFTLYDDAVIAQNNGSFRTRINKLLFSQGKGIVRLTNINFYISFAVGDNSGGLFPSVQDDVRNVQQSIDTLEESRLGQRFSARRSSTEKRPDLFGDDSPGYSVFGLPWSLNVNASVGYSEPLSGQIQRNADVSGNLSLDIAATWKVTTSLSYDFINKTLLTPAIIVTKDLHCWELRTEWYPKGFNQGFYLRFGIKASQLSRDLKIEKRDNPVFR